MVPFCKNRNKSTGPTSNDATNKGGEDSENALTAALNADDDLDYNDRPAGAGVASNLWQKHEFQSQSFISRIIDAKGDDNDTFGYKNAKWK